MRKNAYQLFILLVLVSIVLSACGGGQTAKPAAPEAPAEEPVATTEEPAAEEPAVEDVTLKIYLLDYTADTIAWLKGGCGRSSTPNCL